MNLEQEIEIEGGVESNTWVDGMIIVGEAIGLLDLIEYITKRSKKIDNGKVVICADNMNIIKEIYKPIMRESDVTGESGATIATIREKIEKATIDIAVKYSRNKLQSDKTFMQQPGAILMRRCDNESKNKRRSLEQNGIRYPTKY